MRRMIKFAIGFAGVFLGVVLVASAASRNCESLFITEQSESLKRPAEILNGQSATSFDSQILRKFKELSQQHPEKSVEIAPHTVETMSQIVEAARRRPYFGHDHAYGAENFSDVDVLKWVELSFQLAIDGHHDDLISPALVMYTLARRLPEAGGNSYASHFGVSSKFISEEVSRKLLSLLSADTKKAISIVRTRLDARYFTIIEAFMAVDRGEQPMTAELRGILAQYRPEQSPWRKLQSLRLIPFERNRTENQTESVYDTDLWNAIVKYDELFYSEPNPFLFVHAELKKLGYTDKSIRALNDLKPILERQMLTGRVPQWGRWETFRGSDISTSDVYWN